eukprot:Blabericola_migrator_1__555@NODE_1137_length_5314_cov_93_770536_g773_i0_p3_GENE_NODE_1137_length_5314_cov_93_770536_g773_i0NODE_1137_length_5314_cov_93_770536_g773_i0_p3_ORF_typecomplete_len234_score43_42Pirin/PF02678_16/4_6e38Pirin_C_2/PF17954_1/4_9e03Pirin_C_2/PF17954_1/2_3e17Cupin_2/PF07883_11/4_9e05Cupin_2/PF07883_11/2_4e03Cupin_7/PF12973_7/0_0036Cupin_7/PF12973_7/7_8e03PCO_ADO/PF07847_12/0_023Auxin_BP/PF02041_16/0_11Pirin_C/PF05726_13/2_2Pirin_C/PF05726_13/3_6e02_NODE_1137_length_5314_cov_9
MMELRRAEDRGHANHGWLDTYHTFSFASYFDPDQMGFGPLRVINDDTVQPGRGFDTHSHANMEIISYVLSGSLAHKDSTGESGTVSYNEVQRMSAGTGVRHSEFNASDKSPVHFLQIWITPMKKDIKPSYETKVFTKDMKLNKLCVIASPEGRDGSTTICQDVVVYATILEPSHTVTCDLKRIGYVHIATGECVVNGMRVKQGDGLKIHTPHDGQLRIEGGSAEVLIFDLPSK